MQALRSQQAAQAASAGHSRPVGVALPQPCSRRSRLVTPAVHLACDMPNLQPRALSNRWSEKTLATRRVVLVQAQPAQASTSVLPALQPLNDDYERLHTFGDFANWLIPGYVMLGRYPYCEPSRCTSYEKGEAQLEKIIESGITTFVGLQAEIPCQSEMSMAGKDGFLPYKATAELMKSSYSPPPSMDVMMNLRNPTLNKFLPPKKRVNPATETVPSYYLEFEHFPIEDLGVPDNEKLAGFIHGLTNRLAKGEKLYIHCWGGRGRAGTIGACLLGAAYGLSADEALERVQRAFNTRQDTKEKSPETDEQHAFVRAFISNLKKQREMDVPTVARKLGIHDQGVIGKAEGLVRLSKVKVANSLGAGEVCKAAVCLELACSTSSTLQPPSRDLFIRQGCATKKVYLHTFGLLQKALGVTAAPPTLAQIAVKFGCEHLAKAANALLVLFKSRQKEQVASWSSAAQAAPASAAAGAGQVDFNAPVLAVAALHLVSLTMTWKKGQAKPDVRKMLKGLDIPKPQYESVVCSIRELCCGDLGLDAGSGDESGEGVDEGQQSGAADRAGREQGQGQGRGKQGQRRKRDGKQDDDGDGEEVEVADGSDGEVAVQLQSVVLEAGAGQVGKGRGKGGAGKRRRREQQAGSDDEAGSEGVDDDDAWEVVGRAGEQEEGVQQQQSRGRGRAARSRRG